MSAGWGLVRGARQADRRKTWSIAQSGSIVGALSILVFLPACGSASSPAALPTSTTSAVASTSTTSSVTLPEQNPAETASCVADAQSVETALAAYLALRGTYPTPPAPWSAATYAANFAPLTAASDGGPFLHGAPGSSFYVIAYDSAGHVWVAPPGSYDTYDKGQDFALQPDICDAAVG
jgi:hypothetical protein